MTTRQLEEKLKNETEKLQKALGRLEETDVKWNVKNEKFISLMYCDNMLQVFNFLLFCILFLF